MDQGNRQLWLAYGNKTLRSPIYKVLAYKDILSSESITDTELGPEVKATSNTELSIPPTKYKLFTISTLTALVLFLSNRWWNSTKEEHETMIPHQRS